MILALIAFGFLFEQLGFVVCSLALLLFLMTFVDPVKPVLSIPISIVAAVGVWYVLEKCPAGPASQGKLARRPAVAGLITWKFLPAWLRLSRSPSTP